MAKLSKVKVLSGKMREDQKCVALYMSSWPLKKMLRDVLFIANRNENGDLSVRWWELAKNGQCVPENVAKDLNIQGELVELFRTGKLNCKAGEE